jgi:hypothetical protein
MTWAEDDQDSEQSQQEQLEPAGEEYDGRLRPWTAAATAEKITFLKGQLKLFWSEEIVFYQLLLGQKISCNCWTVGAE